MSLPLTLLTAAIIVLVWLLYELYDRLMTLYMRVEALELKLQEHPWWVGLEEVPGCPMKGHHLSPLHRSACPWCAEAEREALTRKEAP